LLLLGLIVLLPAACYCFLLQLVASEVALLRGVTEACCSGSEKPQDSPFCAVM
jgi:hypothetical protein